MIIGNTSKINLSTSSFERIITGGCLYVDKSRFIENFLNEASDVQLVARQRRLGKSLNMDMLRCFLTDKADCRYLFKGLYIETSPVWDMVNSAPAFYFDFKGLTAGSYKKKILKQILKHISDYINPDNLTGYMKHCYDMLLYDPDSITDGLLILTEIIYEITGKRSYLLIDEYDKLMMDNYNSDVYEEIKLFEKTLLSSGLKGNLYLEKALLTGVMRISHESMLSDLNNLVTYDVFTDYIYTDDYGVTDEEAQALSELAGFDLNTARSWYNGIKVNGRAIYNVYSLMSFIRKNSYDCYWGKSGTLEIITDLLDDERKLALAKLINGESIEVPINEKISLKRLAGEAKDNAFYSFLVQAGYLALDKPLSVNEVATLTIPNKELIIVWKNYIFDNL